jgi:hypothetical protein
MKRPKVLLLFAGLTIFAPVHSLADNVKIIANLSVKAYALSSTELKRVFLEEGISLADGTHVEPVLAKGGPVHAAFLVYLGMRKMTCRLTTARWRSPAKGLCQESWDRMLKSWRTSPAREVRLDMLAAQPALSG